MALKHLYAIFKMTYPFLRKFILSNPFYFRRPPIDRQLSLISEFGNCVYFQLSFVLFVPRLDTLFVGLNKEICLKRKRRGKTFHGQAKSDFDFVSIFYAFEAKVEIDEGNLSHIKFKSSALTAKNMPKVHGTMNLMYAYLLIFYSSNWL